MSVERALTLVLLFCLATTPLSGAVGGSLSPQLPPAGVELPTGPNGAPAEAVPAPTAGDAALPPGVSPDWWATVQAGLAVEGAAGARPSPRITLGWTATGGAADNELGHTVATAGDVNCDGYADVVVGAHGYNGDQGQVYLYLGSPGGPSSIPDWTATGEYAGDQFGYAVAGVGDVNADGYDDVVIGARYNDGAGLDRGQAYLYLGSAAGLGASPTWTASGEADYDGFGGAVAAAGDVNGDYHADVLVGTVTDYSGMFGKACLYLGSPGGLGTSPAWSAFGETADDGFGASLAGVGDVNGDLFGDAAFGASGYGGYGKVYLYLGNPGGLSQIEDWSATGGTLGESFGASVAGAGDVDGDFYADVVIGAPGYVPGYGGKAYLYRGSASGLGSVPDWEASGTDIVDFFFGWSVAGAGDVNADGYADVLVGAPNGSDLPGCIYLYLGSAAGLAARPAWSAPGESASSYFGGAVAAAGDVDGDGYDDLLVGADGYNASQGRAYWYRGASAILSLVWTAVGENAGDTLGAVASAGDVNGDGYTDVLVGASGYNNGLGQARLYLGSAGGLSTTPDWTATGEAAYEGFAGSLAGAGDVNGDGYADVVVGAAYHNGSQGKVYLYLGSTGGLTTTAAWTAVGEWPIDEFGSALAGAGDVNGDGYADLLIGAPAYSGGQGRAYLYLGSEGGPSLSPDWTGTGEGTFDSFGLSAAWAGDVNGDGYADVLVGAPDYDYGYGRVYLYRGSSSAPWLSQEWTATGDISGSGLGLSVAGAGDVDGDGYADVVVSAPYYGDGPGQVYLYRGSAGGPSLSPDWTADGRGDEHLGSALSSAGDVNGDGYADLLVGSEYAYGQGQVYLYLGSAAGLGGTPGWTAQGVPREEGADLLGGSVATAGDVDGDGYADVLIGAPGYIDFQGRALLFQGAAAVSSLDAGWMATSEGSTDYFGYALAAAGDVNGDGYADALIGAWRYDNARGKAYLYLGSAAGLSAAPDWTATGENVGDGFAYAVAGAGDVNGDGYADILVGAWAYDNVRGKVYLYLGSPAGPSSSPYWTAIGENEDDDFGDAVAGAGDVNGDGYADMLVGADCYDGDYGRAYLYLGSAAGPSADADWTATGEMGGEYFGSPVASAGDVNGDGYADILVTAWGHLSETGRIYLYLGSPYGLPPTPAWTAVGETTGDLFGRSLATAGDVNGDGYGDVLAGAGYYGSARGKAYLFLGSATGLPPTADWTVVGQVEGDEYGSAVSGAGDVDGDGYGDVLIGAPRYDIGNQGQAYLYPGSATGPAVSPAWSIVGEAWSVFLSTAVAGVGDVDGDGYADVLVAAPFNPGRVYLYQGNGGQGLALRPGQWRTDGSVPIAPLGISDSDTGVQLRLDGRSPAGRDKVRLQWQVAPLGTPFTATGVISGTGITWTDTLTSGALLGETVSGLTPGTPYHWRVRLLYHPNGGLGQPAGRWMTLPLGGREEKSFRTADGPIDSLVAVGDPWTALGDTTHLTATAEPDVVYLHYAWSFGDGQVGTGAVLTHTYGAAGFYTAVAAVSNSVDLVTDTLLVLVEEPLAGLQVENDGPAAVGQPTTFTATVTAGVSVTYAWDFGERQASGGPVVTHTYATAGSYTATVTASNYLGQAVASSSILVEEAITGLSAANDSPTTLGYPTGLTAGVLSGTNVTYLWDLGDGSWGSGAAISHTYAFTGSYTALVTASNSVSQHTATCTVVIVDQQAIIGLVATSDSPRVLGWATHLAASVTAGDDVTYAWSLGDGATASGAQVTHMYAGAGIYAAVVTASNSVSLVTATTVVSVAVAIPLDPFAGGMLVFSDTQGLTTTISVPPGAVTQTALLAYLPLLTPTQELSPGWLFAHHAFVLEVYPRYAIYLPLHIAHSTGAVAGGHGEAPPIPAAPPWPALAVQENRHVGTAAGPDAFTFVKPVTITIYYSDADVLGIDEDTLHLVYWTGGAWADAADTCVPPSVYVRDLAGNVLSVAVCHLTEFAMEGQ